jgi:hypothetical protein
MMQLAWALVSAEMIKLRRTAALWVTLVAPLLVIVLELIVLFDRTSYPMGDGKAVWRLLLGNGWSFWLMFFVPMLVAFQCASLANLEHSGKHWKQLFAFPLPRWSVYATKIGVCALLLGVSFLVTTLGFVADVLVYSAAGGHELASPIPWSDILGTAGTTYAACLLIIAIQSWLSARFAGMATSFGIGFAATVIGVILIPIGRGAISSRYPWMLPLYTYTLAVGPGNRNGAHAALIGSVGGAVAVVLACWDLARRREHS